MSKLSLRQIGEALGVSKERVFQMKKMGCPVDSIEGARAWKVLHASKRAPTDKRHRARKTSPSKPPSSPSSSTNAVRTPKSGDSLLDALNNAIQIAEEAHRLASEAMTLKQDDLISQRLAVANKASDQRFKAETQYREEQQRRRELISLHEAQDMALRGFSTLLNGMQRLPQQVAQRVSAVSAEQSAEILTREVNAIISEAQKKYAIA